MSIGDYAKIDVGNRHLLSPSSMTTFFDNPRVYYEKNIVCTTTFSGNTFSVLGTIIHYCIEKYYSRIPIDRVEIEDFISDYTFNPDVDVAYLSKHWYETYSTVITKLPAIAPDKMEYETVAILDDVCAVGGTVDYRRGNTIGDYKTVKSLKSDIGEHKWQLMLYAWCDKLNDLYTDTLEVTYIQRPTDGHISEKTGKLIGIKRPDVKTVTYTITDKDWMDIEKAIYLEADTYKLVKANPEIAHLVYRNNPLSFRV